MNAPRDTEPRAANYKDAIMTITPQELSSTIDHTLLRPEATAADIVRLCEEAATFGFASVCVSPVWVSLAARELRGNASRVGTVVGFPHGTHCTETKAYEARLAFEAGARELDMVVRLGALKAGDEAAVLTDIAAVIAEARQADKALVKVILETGMLTRNEKLRGARLALEAGADFVKTSTGFAPRGANVRDVALLRGAVGSQMGVKASGGIRTAQNALDLLAAGADRLGCSASVAIIRGLAERAEAEYYTYEV